MVPQGPQICVCGPLLDRPHLMQIAVASGGVRRGKAKVSKEEEAEKGSCKKEPKPLGVACVAISREEAQKGHTTRLHRPG